MSGTVTIALLSLGLWVVVSVTITHLLGRGGLSHLTRREAATITLRADASSDSAAPATGAIIISPGDLPDHVDVRTVDGASPGASADSDLVEALSTELGRLRLRCEELEARDAPETRQTDDTPTSTGDE